jgi:IS30 family transposase
LTLAEREEISRAIALDQSARSIARLLGRSPSSVSREISRNGGFGEIGNSVKRGFKNPGLNHCILTVDVPGVA